jgi:hypothetical protein
MENIMFGAQNLYKRVQEALIRNNKLYYIGEWHIPVRDNKHTVHFYVATQSPKSLYALEQFANRLLPFPASTSQKPTKVDPYSVLYFREAMSRGRITGPRQNWMIVIYVFASKQLAQDRFHKTVNE